MKISDKHLSLELLVGLFFAVMLPACACGQDSQSTPPASSAGATSAQGQLPPLQGAQMIGSKPGSEPGRIPRGFPTLSHAQIEQLNAQIAARGVPAHVLYTFFFDDVAGLDQLADQQEAAGKDGGELRARIQKAAGLTDDEGVTLRAIAEDYKQQMNALDAERKAIMDARRAQPNPPKNLLTMQEFGQFGREQIESVNEHIDELKSALGDAAFAKLDAYVRTRYPFVLAQPGHLARPHPMPATPESENPQ